MRMVLSCLFILFISTPGFSANVSNISHRPEAISPESEIQIIDFRYTLVNDSNEYDSADNPLIDVKTTNNKEVKVSMPIEKIAEYKGGMQALYAYIGRKVKYPVRCMDAGLEGVAIIQFVVEPDGSITKIHAISRLKQCPEMETEAIRVIQKTSGKWNPASQNGKAVRSQYRLPVRFEMGE